MSDAGRQDAAERRRQAVLAIDDAAGERGLRALIEALGDDSWRVRKQAVSRLAAWPDSRAAAHKLVDVVCETDEVGLRNSAIETLTLIGTSAVAPLRRALARPQPHRKFLVDALGAIGDQSAVPSVVQLLADDDVNVRVAAAEALGRIGGDNSEAALLGLAAEPDMMVQLTALDALAELGAAVPVSSLAPLVDTPVVRCSALRLLGRSRDTAAIALLIAALSDKSRRAREAAIESLARLWEGFADLAARNAVARESRALGHDAVAHLGTAVSARDASVRRGAARLIGIGGHRVALPRLAAGLMDPETGSACSEAIAMFGPDAILAAENEPPTPPPASSIEMSSHEFLELRDLIHGHCGIYFQNNASYLLRRRLAPRLNATGAVSFEEYRRVLKYSASAHDEWDRVVERVSTNETYFFREAYQLRAFRDEILPELAARQPRGKRLTVWSAGCSTGEEPYTIAMLIRESRILDDWDVRVIGSDLSQRVLAVARAGRYGASSIRSADFRELRRFLAADGDGGYRVAESIRSMVQFRKTNLIDPEQIAEVGQVDVLLCRNVLIYFDRRTRSGTVDAFYRNLIPGGYLLLGHSESLINLSTSFELAQLRNDTVYRKPLA